MKQVVTFRVGDVLLGIEILLVREINRQLDRTAVQLAPPYMEGLANLRGQIVTILDLAARVGMGGKSGAEYNIVLKSNAELAPIRQRIGRDDLVTSNDPVGLAVNAIGDIVEVDADAIEPVPANLEGGSGFLAGVVPMEKDLLLLLDVGRVLEVEN